MTRRFRAKNGFTLIELLVVLAILALFVGIIGLPSFNKDKARRALCIHNLRQIGIGVLMYADDSDDRVPRTPGTTNAPGLNWTSYQPLVRSYLGLKGPASPQDRVLACPSDIFHYDFTTDFGGYVSKGLHEQGPDYSSYAFNGGNARTNSNAPGIAGRTLRSIINPAKTVLMMEAPALIPYSWHEPKKPFTKENAIFNDARNALGFVDGHASYVKIHWSGNNPPGSLALHKDPPAGYDYKWSGD